MYIIHSCTFLLLHLVIIIVIIFCQACYIRLFDCIKNIVLRLVFLVCHLVKMASEYKVDVDMVEARRRPDQTKRRENYNCN